MDTLISIIQAAAALYLAYGAFLCFFGRDPRSSRAAAGRQTDFTIGFHQLPKLAA